MAWFPISHTVPQYEDGNGVPYSGAVLKAYAAGTSTPIELATSSSGAVTAASVALNASGFPVVSGNVIIPYVEVLYKLALYPTQAAADANSGAIWTIDNIPIAADFGSSTESITSTTTLDATDAFTHKEISGASTINLPGIASGAEVGSGFVMTGRVSGTDTVTLDPYSSELINAASQIYLYPGDGFILQSSTTAWAAIVSRAKRIHIYAGFHTTPNADEIPINGSSIALTSGGTYNGAQYAAAYSYLWTYLADAQAPVAGGRGGSAAADFAANKKITLPDYRDYTLIGVSGAGSITTVGATAGATTVASTGSITINAVTLTTSHLPASGIVIPGYADETIDNQNGLAAGKGASSTTYTTPNLGSGSSFTPTGSYTGNATSVLQKSAGVNWFINF